MSKLCLLISSQRYKRIKAIISVLSLSLIFFSCKKEDSILYTRVGVTKLTILNFPSKNSSGNDWDGLTNGYYPDIYFDITKSGTNTSLYTLATSNRYENVTAGDLPISWSSTSGAPFFIMSDLSQAIDVDMYDFDSLSSNDYIGTTTFKFFNYTSGSNRYPASITITANGISVKLDLVWLQ
jgi:hypothetical protein